MRTRALARTCLAALCVGGVLVTAATYRSDQRLEDGYMRAIEGRHDRTTFRLLADARSPFNPSTRRDCALALALYWAGEPARAAGVARRAARDRPHDALAQVTLAKIERSRGRLAPARAAWARALRLNIGIPRTPLPPLL